MKSINSVYCKLCNKILRFNSLLSNALHHSWPYNFAVVHEMFWNYSIPCKQLAVCRLQLNQKKGRNLIFSITDGDTMVINIWSQYSCWIFRRWLGMKLVSVFNCCFSGNMQKATMTEMTEELSDIKNRSQELKNKFTANDNDKILHYTRLTTLWFDWSCEYLDSVCKAIIPDPWRITDSQIFPCSDVRFFDVVCIMATVLFGTVLSDCLILKTLTNAPCWKVW